MSRKPAMTELLNGQAVKTRLVSISVTCSFGSSCLSCRAQVTPANPPPTMTMRGLIVCATAGAASRLDAPAAAEARKARRVWRIGIMPLLSLRLVPGGDRLGLGVGEALGNAVHHG